MNATTHQRQRAVRIEIGAEARSYVSEGQRATLVPLTIKRRQNRKLLIPPAPEIADRIGGFDVPMIKTLGKPSRPTRRSIDRFLRRRTPSSGCWRR